MLTLKELRATAKYNWVIAVNEGLSFPAGGSTGTVFGVSLTKLGFEPRHRFESITGVQIAMGRSGAF